MSKIAVLNSGAQYVKLIANRCNSYGVSADILPFNTKTNELKKYSAIILAGSYASVRSRDYPKCDPNIFKLGVPILGICYGMQYISQIFGGTIEKGKIREDGQDYITVNSSSLLFKNMEQEQLVLLTHGDSVVTVPNNFEIIAKTKYHISAIENKKRKIFGVQFHPEVDLTVNGAKIFENFFKLCNIEKKLFNISKTIGKIVKYIRLTVQKKKVIVLLSGGVDSLVTCALLYKALDKEQVIGVHINTGFMRKNESIDVVEALKKLGYSIKIIEASSEFYNGKTVVNGKLTDKLSRTVEPEIKRKIIGDTFMKIVDKMIKDMEIEDALLAQGTLRTDLIESASTASNETHKADKIKTHHNDTYIVRQKRKLGLIVEPLKDLHKHEVRLIGLELNLPKDMINRHPFPGPGLAIRILTATEPYKIKNYETVRILLKNICDKYKVNSMVLPVKTVGVQGDSRTYSYAVTLYSSKKIDWKILFELAKEIPKKIKSVNRVTYALNGIEKYTFMPTLLEKNIVNKLQNIDYDINEILKKDNMLTKISQIPIVMLPISFNNSTRTIVLRPFITNDFMTGIAACPGKHIDEKIIDETVKLLIKKYDISSVMYDLTSKPPGTTEWE